MSSPSHMIFKVKMPGFLLLPYKMFFSVDAERPACSARPFTVKPRCAHSSMIRQRTSVKVSINIPPMLSIYNLNHGEPFYRLYMTLSARMPALGAFTAAAAAISHAHRCASVRGGGKRKAEPWALLLTRSSVLLFSSVFIPIHPDSSGASEGSAPLEAVRIHPNSRRSFSIIFFSVRETLTCVTPSSSATCVCG